MLKKIFFIITLFGLFFLSSCSNDDNPVTQEGNKKQKQLGVSKVDVPAKLTQSSDGHAQMCVSYINMVNGFSDYTNLYTPPESSELAKLSDNWSQTWTVDKLTIRMEYFENSEDFGWQVFLTGTDGEFVYSDWLSMEAEQKNDNSSGSLTIYRPVTDEIEFQWRWGQTSNEATTFETFVYDENGSPISKISLVSNPDGSGEITFYADIEGAFVKQTKITWNSDGSGQWTEYDSSGNVKSEGVF